MTQEQWLQFLGILPSLIFAALAVVVVVALFRPFRDDVLPRLTGVNVMGLRLDLKPDDVQRALEEVPKPGVTYPADTGAVLLSRAERAAPVLRDAAILWVDDVPLGNLVERRLFARLGVYSEPVRSTAEALEAIAMAVRSGGGFDLVISDLSRPGDPVAGVATIDALRVGGFTKPVILYIGRVDPTRPVPVGAFGLTSRPDELVHLVLDALERRAAPVEA